MTEEVRSELAFHLEMRTREYEARGMSRAAARSAALRRFGNVVVVARECSGIARRRDFMTGVRSWLAAVRQDAGYGVRQFGRDRGFTAIAVITLALGIGATTSIFSVVEGVLLQPLGFPAADRIVVPRSHNVETGAEFVISWVDYAAWQREGVFDHVAVLQGANQDLSSDGEAAERVRGVLMSEEFFAVLGVEPVLGRLPDAGEFVAGAERGLVISHALWQRRFGGTADVLGREVRIAGLTLPIVGVLPRGRAWPLVAEFWAPMQVTPEDERIYNRSDNHAFMSVARLREGQSAEEAGARVAAIAARIAASEPGKRDHVTVRLERLDRFTVGEDLPRILWLALGAVAFVLMVACVNVANLLLGRSSARTRELAVRRAMGAGRARIMRQLITENLMLGLIGGLLGMACSYAGMRVIVSLAPGDVPRLGDVSLNATVLGFALLASVGCALVFGVVPAWTATRNGEAGTLNEGSTRTTASRRSTRGRGLLVAFELALSLVLLVSAGLTIRALLRVSDLDPGFRTDDVLSFSLTLPGSRYRNADRLVQTYDEMVRRTATIPGVASASLVGSLPLRAGGNYLGRAFLAEGAPEPPAGPDQFAMWIPVGPGYFATSGVTLLAGREFQHADSRAASLVMAVSRSFAESMFGTVDAALGKRVRSWRDENLYREIVAVVADVRFDIAEDEPTPIVYVPYGQSAWTTMNIIVRTSTSPMSLVEPIRELVADVDAEVAVANARTLGDAMAQAVSPWRFAATLLSAFAVLSLVLGAVGIYGVLSWAVARRTNEIGVRMALGAQREAVIAMVLREAGLVILAGLLTGLAGAWAITRVLRSLLFDISATDPATFAFTTALLATVALVASFVPARRASRVDPAEAMRA